MATYMMLKVDFQNLSKIEIFRKSKDHGWMLIWIINMSSWCYIWCWKPYSIIVAHFQQKCCFSATNVDFSGFCTFIQVKIMIWMKKQHLLPKNNTFVENQQQWCYAVLHIIYSIRTIRKLSVCFAQFFDSRFERIPWEFNKENDFLLHELMILML